MSDKVDDATQWLVKGGEYLRSRDYNKAVTCFDKALAIDPNSILALSGKGFALEFLTKYEEAITYYDKVLKLDPNIVMILISRGHAAFYLKKYE